MYVYSLTLEFGKVCVVITKNLEKRKYATEVRFLHFLIFWKFYKMDRTVLETTSPNYLFISVFEESKKYWTNPWFLSIKPANLYVLNHKYTSFPRTCINKFGEVKSAKRPGYQWSRVRKALLLLFLLKFTNYWPSIF